MGNLELDSTLIAPTRTYFINSEMYEEGKRKNREKKIVDNILNNIGSRSFVAYLRNTNNDNLNTSKKLNARKTVYLLN